MARMKTQSLLTVLLFLLACYTQTSCDRIKDTTKQTINKSGEVVGQTATEFIQGVSEGVDKTLQCKMTFADILKQSGISSGKFSINSDENGHRNKLSVYFIFEKDFSGFITAKVFDKDNMEYGRSKIEVQVKAGEAKYVEFNFDAKCDIESKSEIRFE